MPHMINTNQLEPNSGFLVTGEVAYSHIATRVEGQELTDDNLRRQSRGMTPINKPYTSITLNNAEIVYADPANPTLTEQYAAERLYKSSSQGAKGLSFGAMSKSNSLPTVWQRNADTTGALDQVHLDAELARGLRVTIACRIFPTRQNNGCGLESIILEEPLRLAGSDAGFDFLQRMGYTLNPTPAAEPKADVEPEVAPKPAPVQPMAAPQPAPAPQPVQPYVPAAAPQPAPVPQAQPYVPAQPAQPTPPGFAGGIQFDPTRTYGE